MGNYMACVSSPNKKVHAASDISSSKVKVVFPNGTVEEFQTPMLVAELMLENPLYFVYSKPNTSNMTRKAAAMPAEARLELGQLYFLLPAPVLQSVNQIPCSYGASFDKPNSVHTFVSRPEDSNDMKQQQLAGKQVRLRCGSLLNVMEIRDLSSLPRRNDVSFINFQVQMSYQRYLITRKYKLWKPSLETIAESGVNIQRELGGRSTNARSLFEL
ncbi:hypothetical protein O6H91_01G097700 [Diphasiastrum complanatum]|uniref:Uncharacterized protein n=1 Tax=Diphasiastrum complanatum TaxID=34168 RepID=A0ACC2ETK8_DIPCM|nr:hypothetical protein O6H91_01G097700 [Diphasiastrum complanatum]